PPLPPQSTRFPYTTLFRSSVGKCVSKQSLQESKAGAVMSVLWQEIDFTAPLKAFLKCFAFHISSLSFSSLLFSSLPFSSILFFRSEEHTSELQSRENLVCR